jgi:hypothetical protein
LARFTETCGSASSVVGGVQLGERGVGGAAFDFEVVVDLAESLGERVVGVAVLGLAHDVVLAASKIGESALQPVSFGLSLPGLAVVDGGEIRRQQISPVVAEHSVGVEGRDRVE